LTPCWNGPRLARRARPGVIRLAQAHGLLLLHLHRPPPGQARQVHAQDTAPEAVPADLVLPRLPVIDRRRVA